MPPRPRFVATLLVAIAVASSPRPIAASSQVEEIRTLLRESRFEDATAQARALLADAESTKGLESIEAADAIDLLVEVLWQQRKTKDPAVVTLAERAVRIRERDQPASAALAVSCSNLASLLRTNGDYPRALPLYERALAIQESVLGPNDLAAAKTLNGLGMLFHRTKRLDDATNAYERAIAIQIATLGAEHPDVALLFGNLANVLRDQDRLDEAIALHEKALAIREKAYGPDSREVLANVSGLANALMAADDCERARDVFERELSLSVKHYGPDSSPAGTAHQHLAVPNELLGDFGAALEHAEAAMRIDEKELGAHHPNFGADLNTLASLRAAMGNLDEARELYARAQAVWIESLGRENPRTAQATANLGRIEHELGHENEARRLLGEALTAQEKALGEDALEIAFTLDDLAEIEMDDAGFPTARRLEERALAIRRARLGAESSLTASTMRRLGRAIAGTGDLATAEELLSSAAAIEERTLGSAHPSLAETLVEQATVRWKAGFPDSARQPALRAEAIGREHLRETVRVLAERDALRYERVRSSGADIAVAIAADRPDSATVHSTWDAIIRSRALVLDEMASRHRTVAATQDSVATALAARLESARRRLARIALADASRNDAKNAARFDVARQERDEAERELAERSATFRDARAAGSLGFADVVRSLPEGSALVSFVAFVHPARGPEYAAFAAAAKSDSPRATSLGSRAAIDSAVVRWNRAVRVSAGANPGDEARTAAQARRAGEELRDLVWTPLALGREGTHRLFIVPDAALHLVSFAALPLGATDFLLDRIEMIHYATAERDLVPSSLSAAAAKAEAAAPGRVLLVGAPDFDSTKRFSALRGTASPPASLLPGTLPIRGSLPAGDAFSKLRFAPLPGSAEEIRDVESVWKRRGGLTRFLREGRGSLLRLEGDDANEARVKSEAADRRVLHFATHGFVVEDPENPLLAAGLALAGANHRDAAAATEEDGVLTAEEIASLDLSGARWVVLSACESGWGQAVDGEGIFGLRRAFQVAGARTILMTLWPVDDDAARAWIRELYAARFEKRLATDESVCAASRATLRRLRARNETPHPFLWANYVAAGDWR